MTQPDRSASLTKREKEHLAAILRDKHFAYVKPGECRAPECRICTAVRELLPEG